MFDLFQKKNNLVDKLDNLKNEYLNNLVNKESKILDMKVFDLNTNNSYLEEE